MWDDVTVGQKAEENYHGRIWLLISCRYAGCDWTNLHFNKQIREAGHIVMGGGVDMMVESGSKSTLLTLRMEKMPGAEEYSWYLIVR